jgi:hypothetical protein
MKKPLPISIALILAESFLLLKIQGELRCWQPRSSRGHR